VNPSEKKARPFLKWAGGKAQLVPALLKLFPEKVRTYYEPFVGGGATFFALAAHKRFERSVLNDWNEELVNAYRVVRDHPDELVAQLRVIKEKYALDEPAAFAEWRALKPANLSLVERAARMIFLNKTCFNGLYRVNKSGQFNTPWGKYKNPLICDELNLRACSEMLNQEASLHTGDFAQVLDDAGPGDLVYFDPPYVPVSTTANFTSYTADKFTLDDQYRLAAVFKDLASRGVTVILSNSDTQIVHALYENFEINIIEAKRAINSKGDGRGPVNEVIVVSRPARETHSLWNPPPDWQDRDPFPGVKSLVDPNVTPEQIRKAMDTDDEQSLPFTTPLEPEDLL
jgi:DNA adenine methylase